VGRSPKPKRPFKRRNVVGHALRDARERMGLSQAELAAKLQLLGWDVGRTTWTKVELGERTLSDCELFAVASVLDVSLDDLAATVNPKVLREILGSLAR
jgi:transcriptional regulator with XRE-family HTH domain